jgi:hypothetical protein
MTATDRLQALDAEIAGIVAEIDTLSSQHAEHARTGQDVEADAIHAQIIDATRRKEAAQMRRAPLARALQAEQDAAHSMEAVRLTTLADAKLEALEAQMARALEAVKALALVTDGLSERAALDWAYAATIAAEAGGSPARRHLAGVVELHALTDAAVRKLRHVAHDHSRRIVQIPATKSRAA